MSFHRWLHKCRYALASGRDKHDRPRRIPICAARHPPILEILEERCVLAFLAPVDYATGPNPLAVVTADFTNDGRPDIAVANYGDSTVGAGCRRLDRRLLGGKANLRRRLLVPVGCAVPTSKS
jgi:hypothetical protein